jgi:hypothetical protein
MGLTDFNVLTFDCYGTLIDWETGMIDAIENSSPDPARLWCNAAAENHATLRFSIYKHGRNGASAPGSRKISQARALVRFSRCRAAPSYPKLGRFSEPTRALLGSSRRVSRGDRGEGARSRDSWLGGLRSLAAAINEVHVQMAFVQEEHACGKPLN